MLEVVRARLHALLSRHEWALTSLCDDAEAIASARTHEDCPDDWADCNASRALVNRVASLDLCAIREGVHSSAWVKPSEWVPCSKRLPPTREPVTPADVYTVTVWNAVSIDREVLQAVLYLGNGEWACTHTVVAWRDRHEPYRGPE